jgi:hypothetical protein
MKMSEQTSNIRQVLSIAASLAREASDVDQDWRKRLAALAAELGGDDVPLSPPVEGNPVVTEEGVYRAITASQLDRTYLILLPPKQQSLEVCKTCEGKRIIGSGKK